MDELTFGRMVHFVDEMGQHQAAIVTHIEPTSPDNAVNLYVFPPHGSSRPVQNIVYDPQLKPYTWHWIERT